MQRSCSSPMKNIFITGISGTGKTTIAGILKQKGFNAFSIDEVAGLCHWINKNDKTIVDYEAKLDQEFINSHEWICDITQLKSLLKSSGQTIVLGHAENESDFIPLFDKVVLLQCRPGTFLERILARTENDFGKDTTAQQYLLNTYEKFETEMLKKGAIAVNVDGPIDEVVNKIVGLIQND